MKNFKRLAQIETIKTETVEHSPHEFAAVVFTAIFALAGFAFWLA